MKAARPAEARSGDSLRIEAPVPTDQLVAIDFHTHVLRSVAGEQGPVPFEESLKGLFKFDEFLTLTEMAQDYRRRKMAFVVFDVDDMTSPGSGQSVTNEEIVAAGREFPDVVIPFGSVDPRRGSEAVARAESLIAKHSVYGFKFHPSQQAFFPNNTDHYPLYELLEERGKVALFHSGLTGLGRNEAGGGGIRLKYSNPMLLDDIAVDFPDLKIVIAHPSFPWQDEAIAVALHKPNVFIDLSGWSPKYFPQILTQHINGQLRDKVLFGSDFPALTPERWLNDIATVGIKDEVMPLVLMENAKRVLSWPTLP